MDKPNVFEKSFESDGKLKTFTPSCNPETRSELMSVVAWTSVEVDYN